MSSWRGRRSLLDVAVAAGFAVVAEIERSVSSTNVLAGSASVAFDTFLVLVPVVPLLWRRLDLPFAARVATTAALGIVGGLFHGTICFFGTALGRPSAAELAAARGQQAGPLLAFAGRLVHEKGVQELIKALPLLRPDFPGLRCVIAGTGDQRRRSRTGPSVTAWPT